MIRMRKRNRKKDLKNKYWLKEQQTALKPKQKPFIKSPSLILFHIQCKDEQGESGKVQKLILFETIPDLALV